MAQYRVGVTRTMTQEAVLFVEAENLEEAERKAINLSKIDSPDTPWRSHIIFNFSVEET